MKNENRYDLCAAFTLKSKPGEINNHPGFGAHGTGRNCYAFSALPKKMENGHVRPDLGGS
jgi:hypothetical protein